MRASLWLGARANDDKEALVGAPLQDLQDAANAGVEVQLRGKLTDQHPIVPLPGLIQATAEGSDHDSLKLAVELYL